MVAAGDGVGPLGGAENPQFDIPRLSAQEPSLATRIADHFQHGNAVEQYDQGVLGRFTEPFRFVGYAIFPKHFGIVPKIKTLLPFLKNYSTIDSYSGATVYYRQESDGKKVILTGRPNDLAVFLNFFIGIPGIWSPGMILTMMRNNSSVSPRIDYFFDERKLGLTVGLNSSSGLYEAALVLLSGASSGFVDSMWSRLRSAARIFSASILYEFSEPVHDMSYNGVMKALETVADGMQGGEAQLIYRLLSADPPQGKIVSNRNVVTVDAGAMLTPEGKFHDVILRFGEYKVDGAIKSAESVWIGRPNRESTIIDWRVTSSNPEGLGDGYRAELLGRIRPVFRSGIEHRIVRGEHSGGSGGGGGLPVGGGTGEITAAASGSITAAADDVAPITAYRGSAVEEGDGGSGCGAEFEETDVVGASFGVFADGLAVDAVPGL